MKYDIPGKAVAVSSAIRRRCWRCFVACCRGHDRVRQPAATGASQPRKSAAPAPEDRPRALGRRRPRAGARGVLKELEAARIPIDFVAGTSMGSIVGGLYASGMTPAELGSAFLRWTGTGMFADRPPRDQLSLRRKEDDLRLSIPLEFGMRDGGLQAPRAAVGSSGLETMLKRLTEGVPGDVKV